MTDETRRDYPLDTAAPTLRWLQANLPWTIPYAPHFEAAAYPMDRVKHDVLHVMKSLGRIAAECENHDHGRDRKLTGKALGKEVADLVICALHIAKLEHFDLEDAVIDSSGVRNGVDLRGALDAPRSEKSESSFLVVGEYSIEQMKDGSLWIAHDSGEGMQCPKAPFEAAVKAFYKENF